MTMTSRKRPRSIDSSLSPENQKRQRQAQAPVNYHWLGTTGLNPTLNYRETAESESSISEDE